MENLDFFSMNREKNRREHAPLADRVRPESLDEFFGQEDVLGPGKPLRNLVEADRVPSMVLYGPPGIGKTTLARIIAQETKRNFVTLSAVSAGVKEVRALLNQAQDDLGMDGVRTIIFIDEIHRFNKAQQDALLPYVEDGTITLIGATTENPYFEVNKALLSRTRVVELHRLSHQALGQVLDRALEKDTFLASLNLDLDPGAREALIRFSGGDARTLLNNLETVVLTQPAENGRVHLDRGAVEEAAKGRQFSYDKAEDHYNNISAFIKSIRGSDPDAGLYYLAQMLKSGEDPVFIARRLVILASEDVGNAEPLGLVLATACLEAVQTIGMPEARINLAQVTCFLAASPKSNASYKGISRAYQYLNDHGSGEVPQKLKDSHYGGAAKLGRGQGYKYPHNYPGAYVPQDYLPEGVEGGFYQPKLRGYEKKLAQYLEKLDKNEEE